MPVILYPLSAIDRTRAQIGEGTDILCTIPMPAVAVSTIRILPLSYLVSFMSPDVPAGRVPFLVPAVEMPGQLLVGPKSDFHPIAIDIDKETRVLHGHGRISWPEGASLAPPAADPLGADPNGAKVTRGLVSVTFRVPG